MTRRPRQTGDSDLTDINTWRRNIWFKRHDRTEIERNQMPLLQRIANVSRTGWTQFTWTAVVCLTLIGLVLSPVHATASLANTGDLAALTMPHGDTDGGDAKRSPQILCASHLNCTAVGTLPAIVNIGEAVSRPLAIHANYPAHGLDPTPDNPPPISS